jgi:beta-1,4-glucuronyltransferase 1
VLPIFEVREDQAVPNNKSELLDLFHRNLAFWFHSQICSACHKIPNASGWIRPDKKPMSVFISTKRVGEFNHWEPIFIGTNNEPSYNEKLSWEGKSDKMTQAFIMCLLDYSFNVLSNAFLVHKPGIKEKKEAIRPVLEKANKDLIVNEILPEIKALYGERAGCKMY